MDATYILFLKKSPLNALIHSLFQNFEGPVQLNFRGKLISEFAAIFRICYKLLRSRETWLERKNCFPCNHNTEVLNGFAVADDRYY